MRAAVTLAPHHMELRDVPDPVAGDGEALLRVEVVGVCGSDLHLYEGSSPNARYPRVQGHELSARVAGFGGTYAGPVRVGQRVAVEPLLPCGACYPCRRGRPNCCAQLKVLGSHVDGAFAELVAVPVERLYPVDDLDAELAALVEPISIGMQVVNRGAVAAEDTVAIFGSGVIGLASLAAARDRGARVLVVDRVAPRLAFARALGAEVVVDASVADPVEAIAGWTGGDGAAVVIDATGAPTAIRQAVDAVAYSGRVVIVGISDQEVALPVVLFSRKELTVLGSRNNAGLFGNAVDLVRRWNERLRALVTDRFSLEEAPQALERALRHPEMVQKTLLTVGA